MMLEVQVDCLLSWNMVLLKSQNFWNHVLQIIAPKEYCSNHKLSSRSYFFDSND